MGTVFVLGAGASKDVGLPVGDCLKEQIRISLNYKLDFSGRPRTGDNDIFEAIRAHLANRSLPSTRLDDYISAALLISRSMPLAASIDNFIDTHAGSVEVELCAKLAIAKNILDSESRCSLMVDRNHMSDTFDFAQVEKESWYGTLFKILFTPASVDDIKVRLESVTFVVFNYDRCLEQFLYYALRTYFDLTPEIAQQLVLGANIHHPYGLVGKIHASPTPEYFLSEFGQATNANSLLQIADELKTFTEGTDEKASEIDVIRRAINDADQIVFLGFAYHDLNLELLNPSNPSRRRIATTIYGTALDISGPNQVVIENKLTAIGGPDITLVDCTCSKLLSDYQQRISTVILDSS